MFISIDPGNELSAYVVFDEKNEKPIEFNKLPNEEVLKVIDKWKDKTDKLSIEMVAAFGAGSASLFDTCVWIGIFSERYGRTKVQYIFRKTYIAFLLGNARANDSHVRQYLIQRYGDINKTKQKGNILEGIKADMWQALAIAVFVSDNLTGRHFAGNSAFVSKKVEDTSI
jgi:hypothetical protein